MFQKISLRNYRTHKFTEIELHPITLLIGNNNSGKSNFLAGIRHFSQLVARARPNYPSSEDVQEENALGPGRKQQLWHSDLFPHRYRLASDGEPMVLCCTWKHQHGEVEYQIELYEERKFNEHVACRERIKIREMPEDKWKTEECGWNETINKLILRTRVEESKVLEYNGKQICRLFFRDMAQAFAYHFQPSYLKGQAKYDWPMSKHNLESKVRNLKDVLILFIDVGTVEAEIDQQDGIIKILPYQLSELWFSGTIG